MALSSIHSYPPESYIYVPLIVSQTISYYGWFQINIPHSSISKRSLARPISGATNERKLQIMYDLDQLGLKWKEGLKRVPNFHLSKLNSPLCSFFSTPFVSSKWLDLYGSERRGKRKTIEYCSLPHSLFIWALFRVE